VKEMTNTVFSESLAIVPPLSRFGGEFSHTAMDASLSSSDFESRKSSDSGSKSDSKSNSESESGSESVLWFDPATEINWKDRQPSGNERKKRRKPSVVRRSPRLGKDKRSKRTFSERDSELVELRKERRRAEKRAAKRRRLRKRWLSDSGDEDESARRTREGAGGSASSSASLEEIGRISAGDSDSRSLSSSGSMGSSSPNETDSDSGAYRELELHFDDDGVDGNSRRNFQHSGPVHVCRDEWGHVEFKNSFAVKDFLKSFGAHYEPSDRAWVLGVLTRDGEVDFEPRDTVLSALGLRWLPPVNSNFDVDVEQRQSEARRVFGRGRRAFVWCWELLSSSDDDALSLGTLPVDIIRVVWNLTKRKRYVRPWFDSSRTWLRTLIDESSPVIGVRTIEIQWVDEECTRLSVCGDVDAPVLDMCPEWNRRARSTRLLRDAEAQKFLAFLSVSAGAVPFRGRPVIVDVSQSPRARDELNEAPSSLPAGVVFARPNRREELADRQVRRSGGFQQRRRQKMKVRLSLLGEESSSQELAVSGDTIPLRSADIFGHDGIFGGHWDPSSKSWRFPDVERALHILAPGLDRRSVATGQVALEFDDDAMVLMKRRLSEPNE
jgi:hypothetical protein